VRAQRTVLRQQRRHRYRTDKDSILCGPKKTRNEDEVGCLTDNRDNLASKDRASVPDDYARRLEHHSGFAFHP
jgi:hypothetical protein